MRPLLLLRRGALALLVVAFAAGCATPPAENAPGDLHCDGDRDGIPDGRSPVAGANSTCEGQAGEQDVSTVPRADDADGMPGALPT